MDHPSGCPTSTVLASKIRRRLARAKINFDGTKRPIVVEASEDHYIWYEIALSAYFRSVRIAPLVLICSETNTGGAMVQ